MVERKPTIKMNPPPKLPRSTRYFYSHMFLPINIRKEYKTTFKHLMPPCPRDIADQMQELFMTINLVRVMPVYFSNNVLENLRDRIHIDKFYNSPSTGMNLTIEGIPGMDDCIDYVCRQKNGKGLKWNEKLKGFVSLARLATLEILT